MKKYIKDFNKRYLIDKNGNILNVETGKYLKPNLSGQYPRVKLSKNNKDYMRSIHRLVIETFLENKNNKKFINHIDGNKNNYSLSNLEYSTPSENSLHAIKNKLKIIKYGISSKLSEKDVLNIYHSVEKNNKLSLLYNVSQASIHNIKNNKTWKHLNKNKLNPSIFKNSINEKIFNFNNCKVIKNHPNYRIDIDGNIINKSNRMLKSSINSGYNRIFLNGKNYFIHRLVAYHFIPNNDISKNIVNHIDGNRINNNYLNLEWCSISYNYNHAIKNNLVKIKYGESIGTSKLKEHQVLEIYNSSKNISNIASDFNVSIGTVSLIKNKKIWKHLF